MMPIERRRLVRVWAFALCGMACTVCAGGSGEGRAALQELKRHFEWGEYDQIASKYEMLRPLIYEHLDSTATSQFYKYVGVAMFAKGRIADAREQLVRAYELNPAISLDSYYVSNEIYEFFLATIEEARVRQEAKAQRDSLERARLLTQRLKASHDTLAGARVRSYRIRNHVAGGILLAASVAFGVATAYQYRLADSLYRTEWIPATREGQKQRRAEYGARLRELKTEIAATAAGAAIGLASGIYFTLRARRQKSDVPEVSLTGRIRPGVPVYECRVALQF